MEKYYDYGIRNLYSLKGQMGGRKMNQKTQQEGSEEEERFIKKLVDAEVATGKRRAFRF